MSNYEYYYPENNNVDSDGFSDWLYGLHNATHPLFDPQRVSDYVNQTKIWIGKDSVEHKIKDMDKRYLFNVAAWMNKNTEQIDYALNFIRWEVNEYRGHGDYITVTETPLYKKILARYRKVAGIVKAE